MEIFQQQVTEIIVHGKARFPEGLINYWATIERQNHPTSDRITMFQSDDYAYDDHILVGLKAQFKDGVFIPDMDVRLINLRLAHYAEKFGHFFETTTDDGDIIVAWNDSADYDPKDPDQPRYGYWITNEDGEEISDTHETFESMAKEFEGLL